MKKILFRWLFIGGMTIFLATINKFLFDDDDFLLPLLISFIGLYIYDSNKEQK